MGSLKICLFLPAFTKSAVSSEHVSTYSFFFTSYKQENSFGGTHTFFRNFHCDGSGHFNSNPNPTAAIKHVNINT